MTKCEGELYGLWLLYEWFLSFFFDGKGGGYLVDKFRYR